MADDSRALERKLSRATWLLTGVHVVWFYFHLRDNNPEGSFWSVSDWWAFCKTLPGAATMILAFSFSIAQCVVMFKTPDDQSKVYKREVAKPTGEHKAESDEAE